MCVYIIIYTHIHTHIHTHNDKLAWSTRCRHIWGSEIVKHFVVAKSMLRQAAKAGGEDEDEQGLPQHLGLRWHRDPEACEQAPGEGQNGVSTNGVTANHLFFDRGTFRVLPLTCFYLPKSAVAYLFPQSVKNHYFCSGHIRADLIPVDVTTWLE